MTDAPHAPLTQYAVTFRAHDCYAMMEIEAPTPEAALAAARHKLETDIKDLEFESYDQGYYPVDEISIRNENGDEVALWLDAEHREVPCAAELVDALENIVRVLRAPPSTASIEDALEAAEAALLKARPPTPVEQADIPAEAAPQSAA